MSKHAAPESEDGEREPRVIFRDKRRLDPETGEVRTPDASADDASGVAPAVGTAPEQDSTAQADKVAELQNDLQRLGAEYANYRRRTERDRVAITEQATGSTLLALLPVLDDIERAREHGDLTGSFSSVADTFNQALTKLGLTAFGEVGDAFDPNRHEAVLHSESEDVTGPTCTLIMRRGYQIGERLLRPAMVGVADPAQELIADPAAPSPGDSPDVEAAVAADAATTEQD